MSTSFLGSPPRFGHPKHSSPAQLQEVFEHRADLVPERIALEYESTRITYRELDEAANQLARYLIRLGAGPETCVALWLPRSQNAYVALLGILKSGAAYVPIDPEYPTDRVEYILHDSRSTIAIVSAEFAERIGDFRGTVVRLGSDDSPILEESTARVDQRDIPLQPENLCYVIYTSGSTGKPKGVQIEHRNAVHLVLTEAAHFGVREDDRVFQGFSLAFDASVEELWLAWSSGATLVAATPDMIHAGPDLPLALTRMEISVLSCVPTLLAMMEGDLPTVRLLIVGGEACSSDLVARWCRPGRRMFNTYGPTEATVIATWTECDPCRPVTIGEPLPGYSAFVMDENGTALGPGEPGELYLGGAGLARGYLGRDDLTKERFVTNSPVPGAKPQRLYRTGDLTRWTVAGELEFLGRIDGQVKLRGFRVELSEIESELIRCPGVLAAAVTVVEEVPGTQQLVAYIVPRTGAEFDEDQLRILLRQSLPVYMIPSVFEPIETLPTLTSGKVDRKQLPAPRPRTRKTRTATAPGAATWSPQDVLEQQLALSFEEVFSTAVGPNDDFFLDLGGHSLLAARMVSSLRKFPLFADISMLDVYNHPTLSRLAAAIRDRSQAPTGASPAARARDVRHASPWQHWLCGAAQGIGLYFVVGFFSLQWLAPYLTYTVLLDDEYSVLESVALALLALVLLYPVMLALSIAVKWLVIGRIKPGRYPLWGLYFFRWWFVQAIHAIVPTSYLTGTPLLTMYYRLMGARIGANVYLGNDGGRAYDLLSIGDDSCLGADTHFTGATIEDGWLILGPITIGERCFVGTRTVLACGSLMEDDSQLDDLSLLPGHAIIPAGECWAGSPACHAASSPGAPDCRPNQRPSLVRRTLYGLFYFLGILVFPVLPMAAFFPGMAAMAYLNSIDEYYNYLVLSPFVATSFVVLIGLEIVAVKWLLLGRVRPGRYPLHHGFYYRKWFVDRLLHLSLDVIGPLYSTLYLAPWYRLLGAKIGNRTEVSTASFVSPDCLEIGEESFIADAVSLGAARVQSGTMIIGQTCVGQRTFIGNSALIRSGATIPDNSLLGCLSIPPATGMPPDTSWLGSPSFFLPQRQTHHEFTEAETFRPTRWMLTQRLFIEFFRITLPSTLFIIFTNILLSAVLLMYEEIPLWQIAAIFPLLYMATGTTAALLMVAFKWVLMGRYRTCERPLWSPFVWRTEVVTSLLDNFASPFFLDLLTGTPYVCWFFRLLGAKIGRRVYLDTTELTEFDLVKIGDDVAVNLDCTLQTHLFEDRVMKMAPVEIDRNCHLGAMSLVLYDTHVREGASIGDLSLVMKGETIPANTVWMGIPIQKRSH